MASRVLELPMTAAYFRLILRRFGGGAARRAALLEGTGVDAAALDGARASDVEIPVAAQLRQLENLDRLAAPGWGVELGLALDGVAHGAAGEIIVTARTLGDALAAMIRYAPVRTPFLDLRAARRPRRFEIHVFETCDLGAVRRPLLEMVLLSIQAVAESALGARIEDARFVLPAPRPRHARRIRLAFHGPVEFAGAGAHVSLPSEWLDLACPLADPALHRAASVHLEALRQRLAGDFVDARVERILEAAGDAGATLAEVAAALRVSPRTLVRKLGLRDASFRALLDAHRRRRALELLRQRDLAVAEIAERLGYEEPTSFARACRRWFGVSPRAQRTGLDGARP